MQATDVTTIYDELIDYLVEKATPQIIIAFQVSDEAQERADYITERNKNGELTPEESTELEQMLELNGLVGMLKAKALLVLSKS